MLMIMDPATQPQPSPQPAPQPVMDIKAPPRIAGNEPVKAPPETSDASLESVDLKKQDAQKPAKPPKPPRPHGSGIGLAVVATIIIVLGLGALFVYAFLQTQPH